MSYQDILAVATQEIQKDIPDTLARNNALFNRLKKRFKKLKGGNETLQFPVSVYDNTAQSWIAGTTDVLNINPNQSLVYGTLQYKNFNNNVVVTLQDLAATDNSENAIIDMVALKVAEAKNTFARTMGQAVYTSGTTSNLQINGFDDVFAASGTAYAGLNDTDYPSWFPVTNTTTLVPNYTNISSMLATLYERIGQSPASKDLISDYELDLMLSKAAVQQQYKATLQVQQRFMDEDLVKSGFKGIEVDGIPWIIDYYAPGSATSGSTDNYLYILSTKSFWFGARYGFSVADKSPLDSEHILPQQPIMTINTFHVGNMWCENRRVNGVFKNMTV